MYFENLRKENHGFEVIYILNPILSPLEIIIKGDVEDPKSINMASFNHLVPLYLV